MLEEWDWTEHFAPQPETERYLNYVADKFDLRRDIQFSSRVTAAHYRRAMPAPGTSRLEDGSASTARAFSSPPSGRCRRRPCRASRAIADFEGESYHTGLWPKHGRQLRGQARRRHRHRRDRRAGDPGGRQDRRAPDRLPAPAELVHAAAQRPDRRRRRWTGIRARYPEIFRRCRETACLLHPHDRPARHLRGLGGGAQRLLGGALRDARLRHLAGQLPRHADRPRGQPAASPTSSPTRSASGSRIPKSPRS